MKHTFTRWLPAIAKTAIAKTAIAKTAIAKTAIAKTAVVKTAVVKTAVVKTAVVKTAVVKTAVVKTAVVKTPTRKAALTVAGVAALGGLAFGPTAVAAPVTGGPHSGAVAAIDLATGKKTGTDMVEPAQTTGSDKVPAKPNQPSRDKLIPRGVGGAQSRVPLDDAQLANAKAIVKAAKETGVGERGAVIGVATSLQESKLYNLGHLGAYNDHDSEGLFQQRPSSGWGTSEEITDPDYASKAFFNALKNVGGWQDLPLTTAAQTVQVSAFPYAYAQWEEQAADVVQQLW